MPYCHYWTPDNLNVFVPRGYAFMWQDFFHHICIGEAGYQPGVDPTFDQTTHSHTIYESNISMRVNRTICISESCDGSILTPLVGATTTWGMNIATCSDIYVLYPKLANERRALEGWFPTPVHAAITLERWHIRSSFSTTSWDEPCGLQCPVLWRELDGLRGVGTFRWGGHNNQFADGTSTVGIPRAPARMKW
ncbi:hypothetical protein B0H15DRAFT_807293 [Mycena belliarum]|uniref:Uncharacterized protein n=1 Tax=Mycena belliarum TaxID=1033014 RepID=A0AAD6TQ03_9AGAR|nr:hypothetical protein B0H15DRAFT_807293 [Mycena belliae]